VKINQFACFSLPMICANVLHQGASFNPRTSPAGVMALTTAIPSGPEEEGFFKIY
jgi:hypothetical protein